MFVDEGILQQTCRLPLRGWRGSGVVEDFFEFSNTQQYKMSRITGIKGLCMQVGISEAIRLLPVLPIDNVIVHFVHTHDSGCFCQPTILSTNIYDEQTNNNNKFNE